MARPRIPPFLESLPQSARALAYAEREHAGQLRAVDRAPFIVHPVEVAQLLHHAGAPDYLVAAGVLHDTVEKTDATVDELRERFGARVAALVEAVTEDPRIVDFSERKAALRAQVAAAGPDAMRLFVADKISKVRELRLELFAHRFARGTYAGHLSHYRASLALAERQLPDEPLVAQLRAQLETTRGRTLAGVRS